jgi:hypothetical protein
LALVGAMSCGIGYRTSSRMRALGARGERVARETLWIIDLMEVPYLC